MGVKRHLPQLRSELLYVLDRRLGSALERAWGSLIQSFLDGHVESWPLLWGESCEISVGGVKALPVLVGNPDAIRLNTQELY